MRWLALPGGIVLLAIVLVDVFRTIVMPRPTRGRWRLTRLLFIGTWRPWRWLSLRPRTLAGREQALSIFAPAFLFGLLAMWALGTAIGYALVLWSPAFAHGVHPKPASFATCLYFSGTSLFTIGFGDVVATGWTRAVVILEGATGLGLVALVITYLPTLYGAFNRRERFVLLIRSRAGAPPSGPELLSRMCSAGLSRELDGFFAESERWVADVLESHLSYPSLAFFRSPHESESWVSALGALLDAAVITIVALEDAQKGAARMLLETGGHAVRDIASFLRLEDRDWRIERDEFDAVLEDIRRDGVRVRGGDEVWEAFLERRKAYAGALDALAIRLVSPPAQWIGDRSSLPAAPH